MFPERPTAVCRAREGLAWDTTEGSICVRSVAVNKAASFIAKASGDSGGVFVTTN